MKRNINKQALEGLNLDEEWQSQSPSNDYLPGKQLYQMRRMIANHLNELKHLRNRL